MHATFLHVFYMQTLHTSYKSLPLLLVNTQNTYQSSTILISSKGSFPYSVMARSLSTVAAFLALLLVGATARTTVMTVEVDEDENQWRTQGGCRQQIQQQGQLRHCQEFLRQQARGGGEFDPSEQWGGRQYGSEGSRQYGRHQFGGSQQMDLCCNQLRQLDNQCRCEGLREIVRREQQQQRQGRFGGQGQEVEEIARVARNLPQQCGVGPQFCQIRAI